MWGNFPNICSALENQRQSLCSSVLSLLCHFHPSVAIFHAHMGRGLQSPSVTEPCERKNLPGLPPKSQKNPKVKSLKSDFRTRFGLFRLRGALFGDFGSPRAAPALLFPSSLFGLSRVPGPSARARETRVGGEDHNPIVPWSVSFACLFSLQPQMGGESPENHCQKPNCPKETGH